MTEQKKAPQIKLADMSMETILRIATILRYQSKREQENIQYWEGQEHGILEPLALGQMKEEHAVTQQEWLRLSRWLAKHGPKNYEQQTQKVML